ncbi:MAG: SH3 domain-containing protein [Cyanobacteria bacterium P01_D01_bin.105]
MTFQPLKYSLLTAGALFALGQTARAEDGSQLYAQTVQLCNRGEFPRSYVRVNTQSGDPLRVRSQPAGTQIGLIPDGWAVRVLEWSRNGYWVKVTSHFGFDPGEFGFGSAPDFAEGWVSAGYVKDEGRHCFKPEGVGQLVAPEVFGTLPVEVQGDWLATADSLFEA